LDQDLLDVVGPIFDPSGRRNIAGEVIAEVSPARQGLFLPLPADGKYEGKLATDTFFWRFGDWLGSPWHWASSR
jgi:hypothetical protein